MLGWLLRWWFDRPDKKWKATGYRYTTARDYDQSQAIRKAREGL